jgi:ABC-2 type transport system permease protein
VTTLWTAGRVLGQLRHDRRTVALLVVVPALLLVLLRYVFDAQPAIFDRIGLILLGVFPLITMFLVTSVAMLRERSSGTLERLLTTPLSKLALLLGYGLAFALAAAAQAAVAVGLAYWLLDLTTAGSAWMVVLVAVTDAVLGMAMGLFFSAFARSEFQAVQFMPAVVFPQVLLCGLIWPREQMAGWLQAVSRVMPMTYAVQALSEIGGHPSPTGLLWRDLAIVVGAALAALLLGAATLRRRTG